MIQMINVLYMKLEDVILIFTIQLYQQMKKEFLFKECLNQLNLNTKIKTKLIIFLIFLMKKRITSFYFFVNSIFKV